jgi:hypothetical protein
VGAIGTNDIQTALDFDGLCDLSSEGRHVKLRGPPIVVRQGQCLRGHSIAQEWHYVPEQPDYDGPAIIFGDAQQRGAARSVLRDFSLVGGGIRIAMLSPLCYIGHIVATQAAIGIQIGGADNPESTGERLTIEHVHARECVTGWSIAADDALSGTQIDHCCAQHNAAVGLEVATLTPSGEIIDLLARDFTCQGNGQPGMPQVAIAGYAYVRMDNCHIEARAGDPAGVGVVLQQIAFADGTVRRPALRLTGETRINECAVPILSYANRGVWLDSYRFNRGELEWIGKPSPQNAAVGRLDAYNPSPHMPEKSTTRLRVTLK